MIFGSPGPSPISPQPLSGTIPHVVNITDEDQYQEPVDVGNEIIVAQPLSPLSEQIEGMSLCTVTNSFFICYVNGLYINSTTGIINNIMYVSRDGNIRYGRA